MSEVKKVATRVSYGNALKELGAEYPDIVVLDADLAGSTQTGIFRKAFPDRHINCGIAEGNMMSIAAGIATTGKIPFASSFAMFATGRAYEQIRNSIAYPHLNVKICATHAGISVGADGASHQCLEDIALMRTLPGMVVMNPADDTEARAAVRAAIEYVGPVYIRFGRAPMPIINDPETFKFEIGKGTILKEGKDVTIIGSGICTTYALEAEKLLAADGIDVEIINMCTVKPIDADLVAASAKKTGKVVTAEEGFAEGGLGSAVAEVLVNRQPAYQLRIGVQDIFGESADAEELLEKYQLDGKGIYKQVKEFLGRLEDKD